MYEIRRCVVRQAASMGLEPGSSGFQNLVRTKIFNPQDATKKALESNRLKNYSDISKFMDEMDLYLVHFYHLKNVAKKFNRNKGLTKTQAMQIFGVDTWYQVQMIAAQLIRYQITNEDLSKVFDGSDSLFSPQAPESTKYTG